MFGLIVGFCVSLPVISKTMEIAGDAMDSLGFDDAAEVLESISETAEEIHEYCPVKNIIDKLND